MHAPLYAALGTGAFARAGLTVRALGAVAREDRLARLRDGTTDVALIDLASIIDTIAQEPSFGAQVVLVVTRDTPMAAHFIADRPAPQRPISSPVDLRDARFGAPAGTQFEAEHRALLRRLGADADALWVDMPYGRLFAALAGGEIDVAPDYAGVSPKFQRAAGGAARAAALTYGDCGVAAYGIGIVASATALRDRPDAVRRFVAATVDAFERMRDQPEQVAAAAAGHAELDTAYAVQQWLGQECAAVFGSGDTRADIGTTDAQGWAATLAWRQEVTGCAHLPRVQQVVHDW